MTEIVDLQVDGDTVEGIEGGFMAVRRLRLRNRRADGTLSAGYVCDFLVRPKGVDAVVVALYHRSGASTRVLLREGLRPALAKGRTPDSVPIPDARPYLMLTEVVAGIIERSDMGEQAVRQRAAIEVEEEAGYEVSADAVRFLGAGSFPSPGAMAEKFWFVAVELHDPSAQAEAKGDGSPMEEGSRTRWMELDAAIEACVAGEIEDAKTELVLRRLRDDLG